MSNVSDYLKWRGDLDFSQALDIDHIHPAAGFRKAVLAKHDWGNKFY